MQDYGHYNGNQQVVVVYDVSKNQLRNNINNVYNSYTDVNKNKHVKSCCRNARETYDSTVNRNSKICKTCYRLELLLHYEHYLCDWCENIVPELYPASDIKKTFICNRCLHIERALEKSPELRKTTYFTDIDGNIKTMEELLSQTWGKSNVRGKNSRVVE